MRIVFVSQIVPYPPHGGVLQRGFNLIRELGRRHDVHLLAYVHPDTLHHPGALAESHRALGAFCSGIDYFPLWPKRSRWHHYAALLAALPSRRPFSVLAQRSAALRRRLAELVRDSSPDLVHLDTIALAPFREVCDGVPVVMTHHNIESRLMARRAEVETTGFGRWYVRRQAARLDRYEREQAPRFPLNVMVSELDAQALEAMAPGVRTLVVENGVDIDYFTPQPGREEPALIYTGGMNMFANRDAVMWFLDRMWPTLAQRHPNLRFLAVGQDPPAELLARAEADPRIEVPGFVDDIRPWVARAAVYVVPLRVGGGTRLKVVDAMAQGKAIVSTSVGCEGIRVRDGRDLLVADDPEAMIARVDELLADDSRRTELGRAARAIAEADYAWPRLGEKLIAGYQAVAGAGGGR